MSYCTSFLKSTCSGSYHLFFFLLIVFNYNGSIKNYCITAPSYNPHQQLFVEKLTDNPRVIGRKLR